MGAFHNNLIRISLAAIGLLLALPAVADPSPSAAHKLGDSPGVEASGAFVAGMAAENLEATLPGIEGSPAQGVTPPLTRAATQQHVDEMSPMGWLASYGTVVVGYSE